MVMLHTGSMAALNTHQWYHVAFTWDSDSIRLYLNGILKDTNVLRGNLYNNLSDYIGIGTDINGQNRFHGIVDEIRFSNLARQPWELQAKR